MKKRIIALIMVCLSILSVAACASSDPKNHQNTTPVTQNTEDPNKPQLPNVRYDGTDFIIVQNPKNQTYYYELFIDSENISGDLINDEVYKRNTVIEEKYGINIKIIEDPNPANLVGLTVLSDSDEYDVCYGNIKNTGVIALKGLCYNLNDLKYNDFTKPYWDSNCAEGFTINGKLYGMVSDISLMTLSGIRGMIFNRDMIKQFNLEDPYDLVKNDKWTLDKMEELLKPVSADLDGNGTRDDADRYGMLTENSNVIYFLSGSGIKMTTNDSEGYPQLSFINDKTYDLISKCRSMLIDPTTCLDYEALNSMPGVSKTGSRYTYGRLLFATDHFLFMQGGAMLFEELSTNEMESEYGIVPNPKYDESQKEYYHRVDNNTSILSVPPTNKDLDRISIILEDMAYQSSKTVLPAYYENLIKLRRARVPEMGEMMDIIKNSIYYEMSDLYGIDTFTFLRTAFSTGSIASTVESYKTIMETKINTVVTTINDLP